MKGVYGVYSVYDKRSVCLWCHWRRWCQMIIKTFAESIDFYAAFSRSRPKPAIFNAVAKAKTTK